MCPNIWYNRMKSFCAGTKTGLTWEEETGHIVRLVRLLHCACTASSRVTVRGSRQLDLTSLHGGGWRRGEAKGRRPSDGEKEQRARVDGTAESPVTLRIVSITGRPLAAAAVAGCCIASALFSRAMHMTLPRTISRTNVPRTITVCRVTTQKGNCVCRVTTRRVV